MAAGSDCGDAVSQHLFLRSSQSAVSRLRWRLCPSLATYLLVVGTRVGVRAFSRRREFTSVCPSSLLVFFTNKSKTTSTSGRRVNSRRKREFTSHVFLLLIDVDSRRQSGVNSRQCKGRHHHDRGGGGGGDGSHRHDRGGGGGYGGRRGDGPRHRHLKMAKQTDCGRPTETTVRCKCQIEQQ